MNHVNLANAIAIMQRVHDIEVATGTRRLGMECYQENHGDPQNRDRVDSEEAIHACGNTACFAGYVAISPEFKALGGTINWSGSPVLCGVEGAAAIAEYLDIPWEQAQALVHDEIEMAGPPYFETVSFYGIEFHEVRPTHVLEKLLELQRTGKMTVSGPLEGREFETPELWNKI